MPKTLMKRWSYNCVLSGGSNTLISLHRLKMNDVVEVTNKNINKIVQKMVVTYKDYYKWFPYALYAYWIAT